jgi:hypothetical protein
VCATWDVGRTGAAARTIQPARLTASQQPAHTCCAQQGWLQVRNDARHNRHLHQRARRDVQPHDGLHKGQHGKHACRTVCGGANRAEGGERRQERRQGTSAASHVHTNGGHAWLPHAPKSCSPFRVLRGTWLVGYVAQIMQLPTAPHRAPNTRPGQAMKASREGSASSHSSGTVSGSRQARQHM